MTALVAQNAVLQRIWEKTHQTKIHYISKQEAQHHLRQIRKKHGAATLDVYPCKICGKYVLGARKKKVKKPLLNP